MKFQLFLTDLIETTAQALAVTDSRRLRFTLRVLLSATCIMGMLPVMPALAASSDFGIESNVGTVLVADGLISRLLGGDDDEDDDDEEDGNDDHDSNTNRLTAYDQTVEVEEDSSIRIELESSADMGDPTTFAIVEEPTNGTLVEFDNSGSVTYEPGANFYGSDSFTFKASDEYEESEPATVTIRVMSVNDLPIALAASIATREGSSVLFELRGTDVETKDLNYVIVSGPSHGNLEGSAPSLTYTPDSHFDGTDELTFKVSDGTSDSELAAVKIVVRENDGDRSDGHRWSEPVTPTSTVPSGAAVDVSGNGTEAASQSGEPGQVMAVAQPVPAISPNPIISTVSGPNEIVGVSAAAATPDLVAPQLILPGSLLNLIATSQEGAVVNFDAKAIDDVDGEIPAYCSPTSGSVVPVGTVNIVCAATDAAGNSVLKSFMVAVSPATAGQGANSSISFLISGLVAAVLGASGYFGFKTMRKRKSHG